MTKKSDLHEYFDRHPTANRQEAAQATGTSTSMAGRIKQERGLTREYTPQQTYDWNEVKDAVRKDE